MRHDIKYNNIIDSDEAKKAQGEADRTPDMAADDIDADKFYITQHYTKYTRENHDVWQELFDRRWSVLANQVSRIFIDGMKILRLTRERLPLLDDLTLDRDIEVAGGKIIRKGTTLEGINRFLKAQSKWASYGVPGYLPAKAFFACLAQREFPTTVLIRPRETMDYLPEPDIFHDVFGHVPLHTLEVFADFLQTYGQAALLCDNPYHIERLGRLFWFTVEFGLIKEEGQVRIYGSGLVSSHSESFWALQGDTATGKQPERRPFDLNQVCETSFEIDHFQPIYYVLESFEQLRDAMNEYAEKVLNEKKKSGALVGGGGRVLVDGYRAMGCGG